MLFAAVMGGAAYQFGYNVDESTIERGYRWILRGATERALSNFDTVIKGNPESVLAFTGRGDALLEAHRDREAVLAFSRAIELSEKAKSSVGRIHGREVIGYRFLSYQNQGFVFPFGLAPYLYLRRGLACSYLALAKDVDAQEFFEMATADYDYAIKLAPNYVEAQKARTRLRAEKAKQPNSAPEPTPMAVTPRAIEGISK